MSKAKDINMEVMEVHNLFWESYARRDIDLRFSLCSEDVTFIGSGLHERALNKTEYKSINKEGVKQFPNPFQIEFLWTNLTMLNENVACVESEVVWSQLINDEMFKELLRNTTLLKRDNSKWLVTHVHGSVPDYRLKDGDYMANEQTIIRNRELERQVFERTQDLNKTLEELEQKNRELEIEATLEKVRTVAMGMREPTDMLDVCKTISLQLQSLGVKEIRNVQTAIFYEQRGTYMNYEYYSMHDKTIITETVFTNNKIHNDFATKMMRGKGETFITHIKGSKVKDWIAYQKTTNVFIDKYLETASSLNYYWFSLGPVALGISTYIPLTEDEINLFKRFLKVFELAYQRYLDIEIAESQAREAQIEASLERVRAVAMGMNKSDDLLSICEVSFNEFKKLGFDNLRNSLIHILDDEKEFFLDYDFSDSTGGKITNIFYKSHPIVENYLAQIRSAEDAFAEIVISGSQLNDWKDFRLKTGQQGDPRLNNIQALYYYGYSIGVGDITISTFKPIDESKIQILKRFRNVFDLAYRRYRDIALAEAQAKEAKIEAALEKVRSAAMSMMKSDELLSVCEVLYKELKKLGFVEVRNAMINIHNEEKGTFQNYDYSDEIGKSINHLTYNIHPVIEKQIKQIRSANDAFSETSFTGHDLEEWKKFRNKIGEKDDPRINNISALYYYFYSIGTGSIGVSTFNPIDKEKLELLKRFRNVFNLSYQRYLDLSLAEAQARESQIQLALERVRAKSLSMHQTSELQDVVNEVAQQLLQMKIDMDGGVIIIINDEVDKDLPLWGAAGAAHYVQTATAPYLDIPIITRMISAIKKRESFLIERYTKEEKDEFMHHLFRHHPWDKLTIERKQELLSRDGGYCRSMSISRHTSIAIINHHGREFSEADNKILKRFGNVLEQSYTRFLDLQKAEAQAKEAKIETSLERVRSKAMAMHTTGDLSATVSAAFSELRKLGVETIRTGVALYSEDKPAPVFYASTTTEKDDALTIVGSHDPSSHTCLALQFDAWSQQQNYFPVLRGEELKSYYLALSLQPFLPKDNSEPFQHDEYGYYLPFSGGNFYVWSLKSCTENEISILSRFRAIIDLTFRRYFEIQNAEAQAREAKIESSLERVRARAMSMHTPNDLSATVSLFFKELKSLNVLPWRCGVGRIDEETRTTYLTTTSITKDGDFTEVSGKLKQTGHPVLDGIFDHWKLQKEYYPVLRGDEINDYYSIIKPQIAYPDYPLDAVQYGHNIPFKEGFIFAWTENKLSEEELGIFRRFASVLSLTYRRYLDLKEAEERNRIIQAENDRKTKELEEARQLQLSLLPRTLPQLSQFDIAVYMKTATEVGGDYYDFNVQANGVLNIGIGDATGHGLQAGTMITLMKGFFTADVAKFSPQKFLEHCNGIIRDIKLGRILMSFSHLRFENNSLLISSAGMPPVYYHHKINNRTEEIIIQGLPLGALQSASYKLVERQLNTGDTILLLTDGLPEQMNSRKVIFDYSRVLKYFDEIADNSPQDIINRFVEKVDEWMSGQQQTDDITFVVIRIK